MDPLTFATIVQLVGMFMQERKGAKGIDHQKFMEWLDYHRHDEIKNLICNNAAIQSEVINLLRQDSAQVLAKLDSINATLAKLLSHVEGFKGFSKILLPSLELSDQAVSILRQLVASNSSTFGFRKLHDGAILQPDDGEPFTFSDLRFLSDDIDTLEKCGLITQQARGIYSLTRAGAKYIETVDQTFVA